MTVGYFGMVWFPWRSVWELLLLGGIYGYYAAQFMSRRLRRTSSPEEVNEAAPSAQGAGFDWMPGAAALLAAIGIGTGLLVSNYPSIAGQLILHTKVASTLAYVAGLTLIAIPSVPIDGSQRRALGASTSPPPEHDKH